jgi:hypothetical protein
VVNAAGQVTPINLPVGFKIVEEGLVIDRVAEKDWIHLLGARLVTMEGVPMDELVERQSRLRGLENVFGRLAVMTLRTLTTRQGLMGLVPEWGGADSISVGLLAADGSEVQVDLALLAESSGEWITPPSRIAMPSVAASDVTYTFLDSHRSTALLVIGNLMRYREACELWFADGLEQAEEMARAAHDHFHGSPGPESRTELLAGIPSATETIVEMVDKMRANGTKNLIVDLRGNTGGSSVMREILVYLLFGDEAMRSLDNGYQIIRMSSFLFDQYSSYSMDEINEGRAYPLRLDDYDFAEEEAYLAAGGKPPATDDELTLAGAPSFWEIYSTGRYHEPRWTPQRLLVLSDPTTFSSGFNVLTGLYSHGAVVVGTPSAQPGNNFGDMLLLQLEHTGIRAGLSHKQIVTFPDDPELGRCLRPEVPLTYDKLAAHDFDPNAEVLLALEVLEH